MTPSAEARIVDRAALREEMRARRRALDAPARLAAAQCLRHNLDTLPAYLGATRIAGYWAGDGEMPLNLVLAALAARGQQYYLPLVLPHRRLRFAPWQAGEAVEANRYGIPEPVAGEADAIEADELDVVLLPLVAFDRHGTRLGSGGGYYDRSLAFLAGRARPTKPLLIGVGYAFQESASLLAQPWDVALDYVATEQGLLDCHAGTAPA
jgi:5-formyltetrahydrofolate cyclo-ligase